MTFYVPVRGNENSIFTCQNNINDRLGCAVTGVLTRPRVAITKLKMHIGGRNEPSCATPLV